MNAAGRRELQRCVLETMLEFKGSGWASANDIAHRMQVLENDGRRVAGALRRLHRAGHVAREDCREVVEVFRRGRAPMLALRGPALDYRITEDGLAWLRAEQRRQPRLADQAQHHRPQRRERGSMWPKRSPQSFR